MQQRKSRVLSFTKILTYTSFWFCSNKIFISSKTCRTRSSLSDTLKNKSPLLRNWSSGSAKRSREGNRLRTKFLFNCHWFILSIHLESYSYTRKVGRSLKTHKFCLIWIIQQATPLNCPGSSKINFLLLVLTSGPFITVMQMQHEIDQTCSNCPPISPPSPWGRIRQSHPWSKTCTKSSNCQIFSNSRGEISYFCLRIHNTRKHKFRIRKCFPM